jgi:DNA modification methylase
MVKKEYYTKVPSAALSHQKHLNRQIAPQAHTSMYNFHKYWSRKTWNVVGEYIDTYCKKGGIVFDPFAGSGVTAIEALRRGRKAIVADISPLATELIRLTIKPVNTVRLQNAFERIEKAVKNKIERLYLTKCRSCKKEIVFDCAIWIHDKCMDIRYQSCPFCGDERRKQTALTSSDKLLIADIENHHIREWYPRNRLYYINGKPFKEKQRYEALDELFTKRNIYALAILMKEIENEPSKDIRDFLKIAFTSMVHLCSRMSPISEAGHFTPFSSAWTQHSYWYPSGPYMEQNVWSKFHSSIFGHQGLLKAKEESNPYFQHARFASDFRQVMEGEADIYIYTGSCINLMADMEKHYAEAGFVDYIFTDPPYDSSIQYGELSYMWVSWLKKDERYLENIALDEIIHNERQDKDFETYHSLLRNSFQRMYSVLKPGCYLTVTFHNPTFKVRNATIRAGVLSGFELQKIHHQELARPSAKSLLQPFGSAQGDFYLRFYKPDTGEAAPTPETIDELRFEKIVIDTAVKILAERGEPTPYTIIINAIDPELAKRGFFSELNTGLDVKSVLEKHLNDEFIFIDSKIGKNEGKMWWFKKPNQVPHLERIPLSERVERTVILKLQELGKLTFTDIWEAVNIAFPNSLTSDQTSIREALAIYANPVKEGFWLIKPEFQKGRSEREHSTIIAIIAEIGEINGYKIYIGKNEQSHEISTSLVKRSGRLSEYMTYHTVYKLSNIQNHTVVDDIDVLWIKNDTVHYVFEVECTTPMTSALERGSNVSIDTKKIMLFPVNREPQFKRKMKSPLFSERFSNDNWRFILFDVLLNSWQKSKTAVDIDSLQNKPTAVKSLSKVKSVYQTNLFEPQVDYE